MTEELTDPSGRPLPPQAAMGLLNYVTATSLDEDYAHVSARRPPGATASGRRGATWRSWLVLALFGGIVATAAVQTARGAPAQESSRAALVEQVQERRADLDDVRAAASTLREDVEQSRARAVAAGVTALGLEQRLERLGAVAGARPVRGPGVRIVTDDAPGEPGRRQEVLDTDLQIMANGLWAAGAEAVAINGQRLNGLGAIRIAGEAITVNHVSTSPPYVVTAVGDPDTLAARFVESDAGTWWLNLKAVYDLTFDMTSEESLTLPAASSLQLRHARRTTDPVDPS